MQDLLVINNINGTKGLREKLEKYFHLIYLPDATYESINQLDREKKLRIHSIFTNPNKSKVQIDSDLLDIFPSLKIICTASTGTAHIDIEECKKRDIEIISIKNELHILEKISSTAEMAFLLMLAGIRDLIPSVQDVQKGNWDCDKFIGRQINNLNIGIIGYGRLGKIFTKFCEPFNSNIYIYDPYVKTKDIKKFNTVESLNNIAEICDIIVLHIHANKETKEIINSSFLKNCKYDTILVNTSRGEIINEDDMIDFLKKNPKCKYLTDVISNESINKTSSPIYNSFLSGILGKQLVVTPHVGGVTHDARDIAYNHAASLLINRVL